MSAEPDRDFFLRACVEWAHAADAVRDTSRDRDDPLRRVALALYREAAWCHLLLAAGRRDALLAHLRTLGELLPPEERERYRARWRHLHAPGCRPGEVEAMAADLFGSLRRAVAGRYPGAFGPARHPAPVPCRRPA
jgi:hypothetical protein